MANSDVTLLSGTVEEDLESTMPGSRLISLSSKPHANAIVNAVAGGWYALADRPERNTAQIADELVARIGEKVTLVYTGSSMLAAGMIIARPGTLFSGSRGVSILPKGARRNGYAIDGSRVLDIIDGYNVDLAQALVNLALTRLPKLTQLTQGRLEQLPMYESDPANECVLCVFGTWDTPEGTTTDAIWLAGAYDPDGDIVDSSVLLIRPEYGISEHGSVYGQQLLRASVGEVVGFQPISFKEAIALTDLDYEEARAKVLGTLNAYSVAS